MTLEFPNIPEIRDQLDNYQLFLMPNGIYHARQVVASNYLYPMYAFKHNGIYTTSTSVFSLIQEKNRFVRNPRFQTTYFYRPTYMTLDLEIFRVRTEQRRSTRELSNPNRIAELGAQLIQEYITQIENDHPTATHILLMGGKDSENIILAERQKPWIVLSGQPNSALNREFINDNGIKIEEFIECPDQPDNRLLTNEFLASDCFYEVAEMRYIALLSEIIKECEGKVVIWLGTCGDGLFCRNNNHRDRDYYAVYDLHVGMSQGIYHQVMKNMFNVPVVSPYTSPQVLDNIFYRFDPYYVDHADDIRPKIGDLLYGHTIKYPETNPGPGSWKTPHRTRHKSLSTYIRTLIDIGIDCREHRLLSRLIREKERLQFVIDAHSLKRRTVLSRILFPTRNAIARIIPAIRNKRHDIAAREII